MRTLVVYGHCTHNFVNALSMTGKDTPPFPVEILQPKKKELRNGPLTKIEFFILVNIHEYCREEDINVTIENISCLYYHVQAAATEVDSTLHLRFLTYQNSQNTKNTFISLKQHVICNCSETSLKQSDRLFCRCIYYLHS